MGVQTSCQAASHKAIQSSVRHRAAGQDGTTVLGLDQILQVCHEGVVVQPTTSSSTGHPATTLTAGAGDQARHGHQGGHWRKALDSSSCH